MTVKKLVSILKKCDPKTTVRFGSYCGTVDGAVKGIALNELSPSNKTRCVYIECEITHYEGKHVMAKRSPRKSYLLGA
jgi:hypothetical protein